MFAKRLVDYETRGLLSSKTLSPVAFEVSDKLRPQLATLMGIGGFRALLARALLLAGEEVPWLLEVKVKSDATLEGLEELHARLKPNDFLKGQVYLLAQLLGLLVAFIGEILTLRLIHEAWPKFPLHDLDFSTGAKK